MRQPEATEHSPSTASGLRQFCASESHGGKATGELRPSGGHWVQSCGLGVGGRGYILRVDHRDREVLLLVMGWRQSGAQSLYWVCFPAQGLLWRASQTPRHSVRRKGASCWPPWSRPMCRGRQMNWSRSRSRRQRAPGKPAHPALAYLEGPIPGSTTSGQGTRRLWLFIGPCGPVTLKLRGRQRSRCS